MKGFEADLARDAGELRSAKDLADAGMACTVHRRSLEGSATGLMMVRRLLISPKDW